MDLNELETIAKDVSITTANITDKPIDISKLILKMDNKSIFEDESVKKSQQMGLRIKEKYTVLDKIVYGPGDFVKEQFGNLALYILGKNALMKYDGNNVILVAPDFLKRKTKSIKAFIAHEITHLQDDQLYGLDSRKYDLLENIISANEKILDKRHELGLLKGYILPNNEIRELKNERRAHRKKLDNFMTIAESHAEYMRECYMAVQNISVLDIINGKDVIKSLLELPLFLVPNYARKLSQYSRGKKLIQNAYFWNVPVEKIYQDIPKDEDFKKSYFYLHQYKTNKSWSAFFK